MWKLQGKKLSLFAVHTHTHAFVNVLSKKIDKAIIEITDL